MAEEIQAASHVNDKVTMDKGSTTVDTALSPQNCADTIQAKPLTSSSTSDDDSEAESINAKDAPLGWKSPGSSSPPRKHTDASSSSSSFSLVPEKSPPLRAVDAPAPGIGEEKKQQSHFIASHYWPTLPRFGFPQTTIASIREAEIQFSAVAEQQAKACDPQWQSALKGIPLLASAAPQSNEILRKLVRKCGVPPYIRTIMWLTLSGIAVKMEENEHFCFTLLDRFGFVGGEVAQTIEKDLERTFPDHPFFQSGQPGIARMRRVLHALCWRNPLLDYCQSFNYMVGLLLLFLDDEEAVFWSMCHILERLLPADYYAKGLTGIIVDQIVVQDLLRIHLPKLLQHFLRIGFDPSILLPTWLLSIYVNVLPISTTVTVWDYFLTFDASEGYSPALLSVFCGILKLYQETLLGIGDGGEMLATLTQLARTTFDGLKLIRIAHELRITSAALTSMRRKHRNAYMVRIQRTQQQLKSGKNNDNFSFSDAPTSPQAVLQEDNAGSASKPTRQRIFGSNARDNFTSPSLPRNATPIEGLALEEATDAEEEEKNTVEMAEVVAGSSFAEEPK